MATRKRATAKLSTTKTAKRFAARAEKKPRDKTWLFLETSAQMLRIMGPPEIKRGIDELVKASDKVGTSWYVKHEFDYVFRGFFNEVTRAADSLPNSASPRKFMGMWQEVYYLLGKFFPGGPSLFVAVSAKMYELFDNKLEAVS